LIAPETDKALTNCLKWTIRHRHKLVSPGLDFVKLTANKFHTLRLLEENGVPTIPGSVFGKHQGGEIDFQFPVVIKPIDGAGSQNTFFVEEPAGLGSIGGKSQWLLQPFVAGTAASVSVLSGKSSVLLPPARQIFDSWPIGEFVRAEFNLNSNQMDRAIALAEKCIDCLPPTTGFFGIDLILGENTDGSDDVVCEINPRLTTSYIGLREHLPFNLAATILADAPAAKDDQADSAMSNSTKAASLARSARLSTIKYSSLE
jgi:predicted ATP-grasp superfamily ATP-dependent carboligase